MPSSSRRNDSVPIPEFFVARAPETCLYDLLLERLEKRLLVRILSMNQGDRLRAARYLDMEYSALCEELTKHHLLIRKPHADS